MDRILGDLAAVEPRLRKAADHEIGTATPLTDVVVKVLHLAGHPPGGHDTPEPHPRLSTGRDRQEVTTSRIDDLGVVVSATARLRIRTKSAGRERLSGSRPGSGLGWVVT